MSCRGSTWKTIGWPGVSGLPQERLVRFGRDEPMGVSFVEGTFSLGVLRGTQ